MFNFDPSWMGGIIYIINIVKTLNFLDDEEKPEITLFYKPGLNRFLDEFDYPYLNLVKYDYPSLVKGNIQICNRIFLHICNRHTLTIY